MIAEICVIHAIERTNMPGSEEDIELLSIVNHYFIEASPVNSGLGIKIKSLDRTNPKIELQMRDDLVGLIYAPMLHGGIIAAVLDAIGSLAIFLNAVGEMESGSAQDRVERFREKARLNTIDLRVDYLSPGRGNVFTATGTTLQTTDIIGIARMELHNEARQLIAVGTGSYILG
ncbi:MAG: thioesterase family protein [Dehalococcoidia bacterium]